MKLLSSVISVAIFLVVIFGAPAFEISHGNWPGADFHGPRSFADIRSGKTAKALSDRLEERSKLNTFVRPRYNELAYLAFDLTNKGVVVGPNEWLFPEMRLGDPPATYLKDLEKTVGALGAIVRHFESHGTLVVFELIPRRTAIYPEELPRNLDPPFVVRFDLVRDAMLAEGLIVPDIRDALMSSGKLRYMTNDEHWTPEGAKVAAKVIADVILDRLGKNGIPGPKVDVVFREYDPIPFRGYQQRVLAFTEGGLVDERFTNSIAEIHAVDRREQYKRLNGSNKYRPVLLVGTSYSRHPFWGASQFIGHFGVDIQDHSKDGYSAAYRMVERFRRLLTDRGEYPEVLIWEFPEDFPIREGRYFWEPLQSIARLLDAAPYTPSDLEDSCRVLSGVRVDLDRPPMLKGGVEGPESTITYQPDPPIEVDSDSALCFDINPTDNGPHMGLCKVTWGGGEPYVEHGSHEVILRRSNWLHPVVVQLTGPAGATIDRIQIKPYTSRTDLIFGRAEIWRSNK